MALATTLITMVSALILGQSSPATSAASPTAIISRANDVLWAIPALLLGITLGTVINVRGLGPLKGNHADDIPALVDRGSTYIPYVAQTRSAARSCSCVSANSSTPPGSRAQSDLKIMFREILPNLGSTIVVFIPLILANAILLEAALSYLGAGVQGAQPVVGQR